MPVFDGGRRDATVAQARARIDKADATLSGIRNEAVRQVVSAQTTLRSSLAARDASLALVAAAETTYAAALDAYRNGLGSVTETLIAETQLLVARNAGRRRVQHGPFGGSLAGAGCGNSGQRSLIGPRGHAPQPARGTPPGRRLRPPTPQKFEFLPVMQDALGLNRGAHAALPHMPAPAAFDGVHGRLKACSTMKNLSSNAIASLLALAVSAGVAPAAASSFNDAQPQCGGEKKESKGGEKKEDKSSDTKPKPPVQG